MDVDGEMAGDLYSDLYDTVSYSEKSIKESRGSRQPAWELEVDMLDEDCVEEDILMVTSRDRWREDTRSDCRLSTISLFDA